MAIQKSELKLQVNGGTAAAYLAAPSDADKGGAPGVLVLHAWWGLKPFFKQVCDRLAEQGFTALAPDLYQGRVAKTIDEAKDFMKESDQEWMAAAVKAGKDHLVSLRPGKPIGEVGFSMGGNWALVLAADEPDIAAAVLFYGIGEAEFSKIKAKIQGHFSDSDEWEPLDGVRWLEGELKTANVGMEFHIYPKVGHWFVEEDRPEYDAAAAKLAWERTYEFLKKAI